jgi:hypothetical protein
VIKCAKGVYVGRGGGGRRNRGRPEKRGRKRTKMTKIKNIFRTMTI